MTARLGRIKVWFSSRRQQIACRIYSYLYSRDQQRRTCRDLPPCAQLRPTISKLHERHQLLADANRLVMC